MRHLVMCVAFASACRDTGPPAEVCERARARALANQRHYLAEVMADTPEHRKAEIVQQAAREAASLDAKFVAACREADDFEPACFDSPDAERSPSCSTFVRAFWKKTLR